MISVDSHGSLLTVIREVSCKEVTIKVMKSVRTRAMKISGKDPPIKIKQQSKSSEKGIEWGGCIKFYQRTKTIYSTCTWRGGIYVKELAYKIVGKLFKGSVGRSLQVEFSSPQGNLNFSLKAFQLTG
jgi:hypothetical protein